MMRYLRLVPSALIYAGAVIWSPVSAETESVIEEIVVEGRYLSLDKLNAVKTPTPIIDIPQSLSIVNSEQIDKQAFTNIGDITRFSPGLSISQGEGHRDAIIIRGNQTTADFFIDGVRDDVQYFRPLYNLEQIEILRGANALLFGRGGGGGVINRVTKRPQLDEQFVGYAASVDTFGSYNFSGDINYAIGDAAAFRLNGFYEDLQNHRDFFNGERVAVNPTFAFDPSPDTEVILSYEYVNDDRVVDRGVPSRDVNGVTNAVPENPDVPLEGFDNTFFGSPEENFASLEAHIVRARVDHTFNEMLRGNFTAQYADYAKLYQNLFPSEEVIVANGAPIEVELDGYRDETDRQNLIFQGNLIGEFSTGDFVHTLLLGAEYGDQQTFNARRDNVFADNGDDQLVIPFSDPLNIPEFSFSDLSRSRESQVQFLSVYAQDQVDITDWLKIIVGLRWDRFDIDVTDFIEITNGDTDGNDGFLSRTDNELSPRFGVILKPAENISLYGSYSESFLPRSGDQFLTLTLTNEALEPQAFENIEIGAKWDINENLSFTAALFRLDRESVTTVDPLDQGNSIVLPGVVTEGFELQLAGDVTDWWTTNIGFAYLDGIVDGGDLNGNRTRQTPETMVSVWNEFRPTSKLGVALGLTHQASFFVLEDNGVEVPDFARVDAAIYYDLSDAVRVQVNLENLTDIDYFPDAHSNDNITTGEPINARFTISGRF